MKRKLTRLSVVLAAALSAVVVAGGSAFAAHNDSFTVFTKPGTCEQTGHAEFVDFGRGGAVSNDDYVAMGDWCKDGYGVKTWVWVDGKSYGAKYHGGGAGTSISWDPFGNVKAGQRVRLKVCLAKTSSSTPVNCVEKTVQSVDG